jgi:hypothetical protein
MNFEHDEIVNAFEEILRDADCDSRTAAILTVAAVLNHWLCNIAHDVSEIAEKP